MLLIPVDFSPSSLASIRMAQAVAPKADIVLMHAFDVPFESRLRLANVSEDILSALNAYAEEVASGSFPAAEHSFTMKDEVLKKLY